MGADRNPDGAVRRLRLVMAYDGGPFSGFARQPEQRTVQGALEAALVKVDAETTAARASQLQLARQVDAATGLVLAPLALLGLVGWAGWSWRPSTPIWGATSAPRKGCW